MRQPTPWAKIYEWHSDMMAGLEPPRHEIEPHAGWYKVRLVKGGPFVPAEIWLDQVIDDETGELADDELLFATVNGQPADPMKIWLSCRPISQAEFDAMTRGEIGAGSSDPMKKVNLMQRAVGPNG
jgi:hypothetical protein